jgi:hypothetical protein
LVVGLRKPAHQITALPDALKVSRKRVNAGLVKRLLSSYAFLVHPALKINLRLRSSVCHVCSISRGPTFLATLATALKRSAKSATNSRAKRTAAKKSSGDAAECR